MLLNVALTRTGPALFSITSRSMRRGSTGGTSRSVRPLARYGRKWLKDLLIQTSSSGSLRLHGSRYSAIIKHYITLIILLCTYTEYRNEIKNVFTRVLFEQRLLCGSGSYELLYVLLLF